MKRCYWCLKEGIPNDAQMCDDCRAAGRSTPPVMTMTAAAAIGQPVRIMDLDMPFGSMVMLLVKISLAAIPATLILLSIGFVAAGLLSALVGSSL